MNDFGQAEFDFPDAALPDWAKHIVVFDTETTGLNLTTARIVTACVAELDENGEVVGAPMEWLANPGVDIPRVATNVHGITNELAQAEGRDPKEVVAEIIEALRGYQAAGLPIVAYNAPYDFSILYTEALRYGLEPLELKLVLDPLVVDKFADQFRSGGRRLETVATHYRIKLENAHNATADAIAAGRVLQGVARAHSGKLNYTLEELQHKQVEWELAQAMSLEKWLKANKDPNFVREPGWPVREHVLKDA